MIAHRKPGIVDILTDTIEATAARLASKNKRFGEWAKHVYRFDDVRNAALILNSGRLLSRKLCDELHPGHSGAGSPEILQQSERAHPYARLYFRPGTPTLYNAEGIRRPADLEKNAHCPVPIFLVFDAVGMLSRADSQFTSGSLARSATRILHKVSDFIELPFDEIYHDSKPGAGEDQYNIINHRQCEVLFEGEVGLEDLQEIVCRTEPERLTLVGLLSAEAKRKWASVARVESEGERMFSTKLGNRTYVREIQLTLEHLVVRVWPIYDKFQFRVRYFDPRTGQLIAEQNHTVSTSNGVLRFDVPTGAKQFGVRLEIEGELAFRGLVDRDSIVRTKR